MSHRLRHGRGSWAMRGLFAAAATTLVACGTDTEPPAAPGRPVRLSVSPTGLSLTIGEQGRLTAQTIDAKGRATTATVEWASAIPAIATVGKADGIVTAVATGTTSVTATSGALVASVTVSVQPPGPPVAVSIAPAALSLLVGGVERLVASAIDAKGRTTRVSFEWSSGDPSVATVGRTDGIVTAISTGVTTATATVGELTATATVSVVDFTGAVAFTRTTSSGGGRYVSDVMAYAGGDGSVRSLLQPPRLASLAAPAWSPDGTLLAVEVIGSFFGPPGFEWLDYNSDVYLLDVMAPDATPWRALTANGLSKSPTWSPDGKRIAYLQQNALFEENHVDVVDAAGGAPTRLTHTSGYHSAPRWSPDGLHLTFSVLPSGNVHSRVNIVDADGGGLTTITTSATSDYDPSWSPDGTKLVFIRWSQESPGSYKFDVLVSDVNGRILRRVASMANYAATPVWSPDGHRIMFAAGGALYVSSADSSSLIRLTTPPDNAWDSAPVWRR